MEKKSRRSELLAIEPKDIMEVTSKGFFIDKDGKVYMQTKGRLYDAGGYDDTIHGEIVPRGVVQKNEKRDGLKIAKLPRLSGSGPLTNKEFERALKIINTTSPNEMIRQQREDILIQQARFGV